MIKCPNNVLPQHCDCDGSCYPEEFKLPRLVALGGLKGSGKSTAAQALLDRGYIGVKMAGGLKAMLVALLRHQGMSPIRIAHCIEGDLKEEPIDELNGRSPRYAMQTLGDDWGRSLIHPELWSASAACRIHSLRNEGERVFVDDVRYPNELEMLEEIGATSVYIQRAGALPEPAHPSERSLGPSDFHAVLDNDKSIEELHAELLETLRGSVGGYNNA